jgi:ribosome-associated protein
MDEKLSKSALKRRFKDEEKAAGEVALLSDRDLGQINVSEDLLQAARHCRELKGGARKRQVKYIAKIMREEGVEEILDFLEHRKGSKAKENIKHREAERLRDALINEAISVNESLQMIGEVWEPDWRSTLIEQVEERYPVDVDDLRKSIFSYVKTRAQNHYRETFRILRAAMNRDELLNKVNPQ